MALRRSFRFPRHPRSGRPRLLPAGRRSHRGRGAGAAFAIAMMMALTNGAYRCKSINDLTPTDLIVVSVDDSASGKTSQINRIQSISSA